MNSLKIMILISLTIACAKRSIQDERIKNLYTFEQDQVVVGKILETETEGGSAEYILQIDSKQILDISSDLHQHVAPFINKEVRIKGHFEELSFSMQLKEIDSIDEVGSHFSSFQTHSTGDELCDVGDLCSKQTLMVLTGFNGSTAGQSQVDYINSNFENYVNSKFKIYSNHRYQLSPHVITLPLDMSSTEFNCSITNAYNAFLVALEQYEPEIFAQLDNYRFVHALFPSLPGCSFSGIAWIGGTFSLGRNFIGTTIHEIGHSEGLYHSHDIPSNCAETNNDLYECMQSGYTYGDYYAEMGSGSWFNATKSYLMGMFSETNSQVYNFNGEQNFSLDSYLDINNHLKILEIPLGHRYQDNGNIYEQFYTVSKKGNTHLLHISERSQSHYWTQNTTYLVESLSSNETFNDSYRGIEIRVINNQVQVTPTIAADCLSPNLTATLEEVQATTTNGKSARYQLAIENDKCRRNISLHSPDGWQVQAIVNGSNVNQVYLLPSEKVTLEVKVAPQQAALGNQVFNLTLDDEFSEGISNLSTNITVVPYYACERFDDFFDQDNGTCIQKISPKNIKSYYGRGETWQEVTTNPESVATSNYAWAEVLKDTGINLYTITRLHSLFQADSLPLETNILELSFQAELIYLQNSFDNSEHSGLGLSLSTFDYDTYANGAIAVTGESLGETLSGQDMSWGQMIELPINNTSLLNNPNGEINLAMRSKYDLFNIEPLSDAYGRDHFRLEADTVKLKIKYATNDLNLADCNDNNIPDIYDVASGLLNNLENCEGNPTEPPIEQASIENLRFEDGKLKWETSQAAVRGFAYYLDNNTLDCQTSAPTMRIVSGQTLVDGSTHQFEFADPTWLADQNYHVMLRPFRSFNNELHLSESCSNVLTFTVEDSENGGNPQPQPTPAPTPLPTPNPTATCPNDAIEISSGVCEMEFSQLTIGTQSSRSYYVYNYNYTTAQSNDGSLANEAIGSVTASLRSSGGEWRIKRGILTFNASALPDDAQIQSVQYIVKQGTLHTNLPSMTINIHQMPQDYDLNQTGSFADIIQSEVVSQFTFNGYQSISSSTPPVLVDLGTAISKTHRTVLGFTCQTDSPFAPTLSDVCTFHTNNNGFNSIKVRFTMP